VRASQLEVLQLIDRRLFSGVVAPEGSRAGAPGKKPSYIEDFSGGLVW